MQTIWLKRVWIPFWVAQLVVAIALFVLQTIDLALSVQAYNAQNAEDSMYGGLAGGETGISNGGGYDDGFDTYVDDTFYQDIIISSAVFMAFTAMTILFNISMIIRFACHQLTPVFAVVLNSILTASWVVLFIISFFVLYSSGPVGWAFSGWLFLTSLGMLIYSGVILGRQRQESSSRGAYFAAQTNNPNATTDPYGNPMRQQENLSAPNPFQTPSRGPSPARPDENGGTVQYYDPVPSVDANTHEQQNTAYHGAQGV